MDKRIKCLDNLLQLQKDIVKIDEEYISITLIEGKTDRNAYRLLEHYISLYRKEYNRCEEIIKR